MSSDLKKELLAVLASHTDSQLNERFQKLLGDPNTIKYSQSLMKKHSSLLKKIRKHSDTLALQLNMPTKDDVANVANLCKQIEEKLDVIENQLHQLMKNQETILEENKSEMKLEKDRQHMPVIRKSIKLKSFKSE